MKKIVSTALLALVLIMGLGAEAYGYRTLGTNPFLSPSYSDRFQDAFMSPSQLPRVDSDAIFYLTTLMSEEWDLEELVHGGELSWIQNGRTEMQSSFVGKNLALTAYTSTWFSNRRNGAELIYDIWNTLGIELDWGISFSWFSMGATIRGGSEMVRKDRVISDWANAMSNAYFSSFSHVPGGDFFSVGISAAVDTDVFGLAVGVDDLISLRNEDIYIGWDAIADSLSISLSLRSPEFNRRGDLNLVRPRCSWTVLGNPTGHDMETSFKGELVFQLLPELDLTFGLGYRETSHGWFDFNTGNGLFMTGFSVLGESFGVTVLLNVSTADWTRFSPAISFTWAR